MAYMDSLRTIEDITTGFLLGYKRSTEDYTSYLDLACRSVRDFNLYHNANYVTAKVDITANKLIEMPDDMIGFIDLSYPLEGRLWSFTRQDDIVNTTTFTGLVEGRDSDAGEGVNIKHALSTSYAAKGGVNTYNYTIDWEARRIFIDGIDTDTAVLKYVSSGITVSGITYVPEFIVPVIEGYLLWRETYFLTQFAREREQRKAEYKEEVLKARYFVNSLSYNELRDLLLGSATQSVRR